MHPTAALPRAWWFPNLRGYRSEANGTYARFPLDEQPRVAVSDDLSWLEDRPRTDLGIDTGDEGQQVRPLTTADLDALAGHLPLPASLRLFAARPDLQPRVPSVTACYLDLGDLLVPTTVDGGHLLHVLSDQQWVCHWLLYTDADRNEAVVVSGEPIGFRLDKEWEDPPPEVIPMDGSYDLEVAADSFVEFLYRFWIENELWLALEHGGPLSPALADYASQLPSG
jgi:hypothetical protein